MKMAMIKKGAGRWKVIPWEDFGEGRRYFELRPVGWERVYCEKCYPAGMKEKIPGGEFWKVKIVDLELRPYMGYNYDPESGAVLVFAYSLQQAKVVAWHALDAIEYEGVDYFDVRVNAIEAKPWLMSQRLKDKDGNHLIIPHYIDEPETCKGCERWGIRLIDGICRDCSEEGEQE